MLCLIVVLVSMPKAALDWRGGVERWAKGKALSGRGDAIARREIDRRRTVDGQSA